MKQSHSKWWKEGLHVLGITAVAVLLTRFIIYDVASLGVFAPLEKEMDFEISDIYNAVEENQTVRSASPDVIVVSVDNHNRAQVLEDLQKIIDAEPAAIGLDVYFKVYQEDVDSLLLATVMNPEHRIVGSTKAVCGNDGYYEQFYMSYYEETHHPVVGYTNIDPANEQKVIRSFRPFVLKAPGDTLKSMELLLATMADPKRAKALLDRGNEVETIDFTRFQIPVVEAEKLDEPDVRGWLKNKVVMVGDVRDGEDMRITPLHGYISGVMVHAYGVETILQGSYIRAQKTWVNWVIAILICIVFVAFLLLARNKMSNVGNLLIRIAQFVIMYVLVVLGCMIFAGHHTYINFAPSILMLGFGALAFDLWFACYGIILTIIEFIQKHLCKK